MYYNFRKRGIHMAGKHEEDDWISLVERATSLTTPKEQLDELSHHPDSLIRQAVARNPNISLPTLLGAFIHSRSHPTTALP
jgi:hypothetical protein